MGLRVGYVVANQWVATSGWISSVYPSVIS